MGFDYDSLVVGADKSSKKSEHKIELTPTEQLSQEIRRRKIEAETSKKEKASVQTEVVKPEKPVKSSDKSKTKKTPSDYVNMRTFPLSVVGLAQAEFPTATTRANAVAAYMLIKSGESLEGKVLPDEVKTLVKEYKGDKTAFTMAERLDSMDKRQMNIINKLNELELMIGYILCDRLGYRRETSSSPRDVNFNENAMFDMLMRAREQSTEMTKQIQYRTGRPMKQNERNDIK